MPFLILPGLEEIRWNTGPAPAAELSQGDGGPIQEHSAVVDSSVDSTSTESEIYEIDKGFQRLRCPSLIYNIYIYMSRDPPHPSPPSQMVPPPVVGEGGFLSSQADCCWRNGFLADHVYIYIYTCTVCTM